MGKGNVIMDMRQLQADSNIWQILQERAQALSAQQTETTIEQGEETLTFRLGHDGFRIPAQHIREVQPLRTWTPLPTTPPFVIGLVNVRGKILTALDLRPLLGVPQQPPSSDAFLIIIHGHGIEVGLLADSVVEVRRGTSELAPTLSAVAGHGLPWVLGIDAQRNLAIDPPLLLADPRVLVNDETL